MERNYTLDDLKALSPDLLEELYEIIVTMRYTIPDKQSQQIAVWTNKDECCPYCGSKDYKRNGHQKNGAQKFMCKHCGRSFSMVTDTTALYSHFDIQKWNKFIECEINGLPSRKTATIVGINRNTALLWRHKLYDVLGYLQETKLNNQIQIDAKNISINFKGNKDNKPRTSKKRKSNHNHSKNRHSSCIIGAIDDEDHLVLKIAGFGKERIDMYRSVLKNIVKEGSLIISDGIQGIEGLAKEMGCTSEVVKSDTHLSIHGLNINTINQIHAELEVTLTKYRGISTRHLQGYLNMFVLRKHLNYTCPNQFQVREAWLAAMPKKTVITRRNESSYPYPFDIQEAYRDYTDPEFTPKPVAHIPEQFNGVA